MTFDEANAFIQKWVPKITTLGSLGLSRSVPARIRAHCFYSARVADSRVLGRFKDVSDAFSAGQIDRSEARHMLRTFTQANGLDDGSRRITNLAAPARLNLVLTMNARMGEAVGRYARDRDPVVEERFPCWRYHAGRNPRAEHAQYDGMVFRKNDPIWHKIYPPWEFNCNCWVENCDEEPAPSDLVARLTPQAPPKSGFEFDPAEAFEDYKVDNFDFDTPEAAPDKTIRIQAERLEHDELKRLYRDVEDRQPGIIAASDDWWSDLKKEERELVQRYTASDVMQLNMASRGKEDMTRAISQEMDELSAVLEKAPKYTGGTLYRVINLESGEELDELRKRLTDSIVGLSGFNSTSVSMASAKRYLRNDAAHKVVFHVVNSRSGAFIGHHSWIETDKEVFFDRKIKFRALKPGEEGYINYDKIFRDGLIHIAITEV